VLYVFPSRDADANQELRDERHDGSRAISSLDAESEIFSMVFLLTMVMFAQRENVDWYKVQQGDLIDLCILDCQGNLKK